MKGYTNYYSEETVKLLLEKHKTDITNTVKEGCPLHIEMLKVKQPKFPKGEILVKGNKPSFWSALGAGIAAFLSYQE